MGKEFFFLAYCQLSLALVGGTFFVQSVAPTGWYDQFSNRTYCVEGEP